MKEHWETFMEAHENEGMIADSPPIYDIDQVLFLLFFLLFTTNYTATTVGGRNPAPSGMYKTRRK